MYRVVAAIAILALTAGLLAAPSPKPEPKPKDMPDAEFIRKVLDSKATIEFNGINLPAVLAQLSEDHRINFVLDRTAVNQMGFEPNDLNIDFKMKDVKLRTGVRAMLNQYNLTTAVVGDAVLVTTEEQAIYKQLKHRISVSYDEVPLKQAVRDLAKVNGVNVVIDPKAVKTKAADEPVTLHVDDVPFEAVIRLMCEMAGLKPARMGNVIYITTEDRANKLRDSDSLVSPPNGGGVIGGPGVLLPGANVLPAPPVGNVVPAVESAPAPPAER